jgi:hypothetical protein
VCAAFVISSSHFIKTQFCQIFAEEEEKEQEEEEEQQNVCPAVGSARENS